MRVHVFLCRVCGVAFSSLHRPNTAHLMPTKVQECLTGSWLQKGQDHSSIAGTVDAAIDLWTRMLIAEAVHDNQIVDNVTRMEDQCNAWLVEQIQALDILLGKTDFPDPGLSRTPSFDPSMYPVREASPPLLDEGSTDSFAPVQGLSNSFRKLFNTVPRSPGDAASKLRTASVSSTTPRRQTLDSNGRSSRHATKAPVAATRARLSPSDLDDPHSPFVRSKSAGPNFRLSLNSQLPVRS